MCLLKSLRIVGGGNLGEEMELLYILLVVLAMARGLGEVAVWLGQPALVGELIAGILIGVVSTFFHEQLPLLNELSDNDTFLAIADLGVFFLMLLGGVELKTKNITESSKPAILVAIGGMILPLSVGYLTGYLIFPESEFKVAQCLFTGTALAITAVPVTIRVLMDINKLESPVGSLIVSSAIIDDVLSLVLLAILTAFISEGQIPDTNQLIFLVGNVVAFFLTTFLIGKIIFTRFRLVERLKSAEFEFSCLILIALLFSVLAEKLNLHFILGAFMAGLLFGRKSAGSETYEILRNKLNAITKGFLAPIFFVSIGLHLNLIAFTEIPFYVFSLVLIAVLTKLVGAGVPAKLLGFSLKDSVAIGIGMSGRGAVELIIADIALRAGLFSKPTPVPNEIKFLFSAVVIVAITTTIFTPLGLKLIYHKE